MPSEMRGGKSAGGPGAKREIDQASQKDQGRGPGGDGERISGFHSEFRMRCEQPPGQSVGRQSSGDAEREAENDIALEGHRRQQFGIAVSLIK